MARNEAKRQQKLMKKRQKDKLRRQHLAEVMPYSLWSPKKKILQARAYPLHECLINTPWRDSGLATILISRSQPDGNLTFGGFLVDIFCLGLKNTLCNADFSLSRYNVEVVPKAFQGQHSEPCSSELAHQIIYGAIAYARQFGFKPNEDFALSQHLLESPEDIAPSDFEFGQDGKPFFIAGPDDDIDRILHQLRSTAGEGNFHFIHPMNLGDIGVR